MDLGISQFFQTMESGFANFFFGFFYYLANPLLLLFAGGALYFLVGKKFTYRFMTVAMATLFLNGILKLMFNRPRPYRADDSIRLIIETDPVNVSGNSMPSGHAMMAAGYPVVVLREYGYGAGGKKRLWLFILMPVVALMIGLCRIYMGAHYFTDIIAGFAIGFALACLIEFAFAKLKDKIFLWALVVIPFILLGLALIKQEDSCSVAAGIIIPLLVGGYLDHKFLKLNDGATILTRIIRAVVAAAGAGLFLMIGAKGISEPWLSIAEEGSDAYYAIYTWSYFIMFLLSSAWMYIACPYIFKYAPKLFKKQKPQDAAGQTEA